MLTRRELELAILRKGRVGSVLETIAVTLRHGKFQQAFFELANELRQRFSCLRVALGLVENAAGKMTALPEAATFERNTPWSKPTL